MQNTTRFTRENVESLVTTGAGFDILRHFSLPDMLGEDSEHILYIMGRNIARRTEISSIEDISFFMQYFGWGDVTEVRSSKKERTFSLTGHVIEKRLNQDLFSVTMRMEAGFLAECFTILDETLYECREEHDNKQNRVLLTVYHL